MKNRTQSTPFLWNLVTKNLHGHELLRKKLHEKITKLDQHLEHYPPGTVHLQIVLERLAALHAPFGRVRALTSVGDVVILPDNSTTM